MRVCTHGVSEGGGGEGTTARTGVRFFQNLCGFIRKAFGPGKGAGGVAVVVLRGPLRAMPNQGLFRGVRCDILDRLVGMITMRFAYPGKGHDRACSATLMNLVSWDYR